jgi:putative Ca2+/H+ antiporter (TMEM165/GDT1 family)
MNRFHMKKDYYGGALMIFIGLTAAIAATNYNLGTLSRMGPGFFPCAVGVLMAVTGLLIAVSATDDKPAPGVMGHSHQIPDLRGAGCIIAAILAFIGIGDYLGLLPATFAIVFISAMGDRKNTVKSALILAAAMMLIATVVFWWALQLQMPLVKWGA